MLPENILKAAPPLNKKPSLATEHFNTGEFSLVNGEFSNLLMRNEHPEQTTVMTQKTMSLLNYRYVSSLSYSSVSLITWHDVSDQLQSMPIGL